MRRKVAPTGFSGGDFGEGPFTSGLAPVLAGESPEFRELRASVAKRPPGGAEASPSGRWRKLHQHQSWSAVRGDSRERGSSPRGDPNPLPLHGPNGLTIRNYPVIRWSRRQVDWEAPNEISVN